MRIVILGPPASGKGTQAELLSQHLGVPTISTGDMLRAEIARNTAIGQRIDADMKAGKLAPDGVIEPLLEDRLREPDTLRGFILDGYPRTPVQAEFLQNLLDRSDERVDWIIDLDVTYENLQKRMIKRRQAWITRGYTPRTDDVATTLQGRYETYLNNITGLREFYFKDIARVPMYSHIDANHSKEQTAREILQAKDQFEHWKQMIETLNQAKDANT